MEFDIGDYMCSKTGQMRAYAWPGGFPIYYMSVNGMTYCP